MHNPRHLAASSDQGVQRLLDPDFMIAHLERALTPLAGTNLRITHFKAKPAMTRKAVRAARTVILYTLDIESERLGERRYRILATAPVEATFHGDALLAACRSAQDLECVRPFRHLAGHIEELKLAFHFIPVDLRLPALVELLRPEATAVLARYLPECAAGAAIDRFDIELKHYKPGKRCVLRATARFVPAHGAPAPRSVYIKLFADDRGETSHRHLEALWKAACASSALRVPEPLGYDPRRRMLITAESPGKRDLVEWLHCLEHGLPLPPGVDLERVRRCLEIIAQAMHDLHGAHINLESRRTYFGELNRIRKDYDIMKERQPLLAAEFAELLARLVARAPRHEPMVVSHGAFRHKHVLGDDRCLTLIDWDGLTQANPALDAAIFLRRLRQEPVQHPGSAPVMEALADHFRAHVVARNPQVADHLRCYEALSLTEAAVRFFRRKARNGQCFEEIRNHRAAATALLDG